MIIFTNNITQIEIQLKNKPWNPKYFIKKNYKNRIGYKHLVFPVYEIIKEAVIHKGFSENYFACELDKFNEYQKNQYFEDGILYDKPHCIIYLTDGNRQTIYFDTNNELDKYVTELKNANKHIEIK